jgi:hypothetical protein
MRALLLVQLDPLSARGDECLLGIEMNSVD